MLVRVIWKNKQKRKWKTQDNITTITKKITKIKLTVIKGMKILTPITEKRKCL
jgi:hypothetical protein